MHDYFNLPEDDDMRAKPMNVVQMEQVAAYPRVQMMALSSLKPASEAPKELGLQVRRSSDAEGLPTLEASIRTHGIIVPLVVYVASGNIYVVAGNRRLKVLRQIHGEMDVMVPVVESIDFNDSDAREIAMATNVALPPHPVDRYEVISQLIAEGMTPRDAMMRFGMSDRQLAQTLRLGNLAPFIREKWRSGEISGEAAQVFTLADPKDHERVYKQVAKETWDGKINAEAVRSRIIPTSQREAGALVEFVGIEECRKMGLLKQEDMFASNHTVENMRDLKKVADVKIGDICSRLVKDGWSWAEVLDGVENRYSYGRLDANKKGAFTAEQMAKSGCFLHISAEGTLEIDYGRVKPEERRKAEKKEKKDAAKPGKAEPAQVSAALKQRLQEQLRSAGAEVLKFDHAVAVSAMIAAFASGDVLEVHGGTGKPAAFESVFATAMKSSPEQRAMMLAQVAAQALRAVDIASKPFAALFAAMQPTTVRAAVMAAFDAQDYFGAVPLTLCVEAAGEAIGVDVAARVAKMKKADAAKFCTENLPKSGWLPKELRTAHHEAKKGKR